jgi:hypothetical protein
MPESEFISVKEARDLLGVSEPKMAQMLRDGVLKWEPNLLDKRGKVVRRTDVEALAGRFPRNRPLVRRKEDQLGE